MPRTASRSTTSGSASPISNGRSASTSSCSSSRLDREIHPPDELSARAAAAHPAARDDGDATSCATDSCSSCCTSPPTGQTQPYRAACDERARPDAHLVERRRHGRRRWRASPSSAARCWPTTNIGVGVFVRDPDGQLLELLPMSYRDSLARARRRVSDCRRTGTPRASSGLRARNRRSRAGVVTSCGAGQCSSGATRSGDGRHGLGSAGAGCAGTRRGPGGSVGTTPRRSSSRQPCGGVSVPA